MSHPIENKPKRAGVWNIRDFVIKKIGPVVDEYAEWYADHGVSLPEAYQFDPTGWTEILRRIQRAFYLAAIEKESVGEFAEAQLIQDEARRKEVIDGYRQEISDGFRMFGKHLNDLYDKYESDKP